MCLSKLCPWFEGSSRVQICRIKPAVFASGMPTVAVVSSAESGKDDNPFFATTGPKFMVSFAELAVNIDVH